MGLSACTIKTDKKDTESGEDVIKKMDENNKWTEDDIDRILNNPVLVAGGQPGKISVSGIVVKEEDRKTLSDERISKRAIFQSPVNP